MRHVCFILAMVLSSTSAFGREWTDVSGKYHCNGTFLRQTDDKVWLLKDATQRPVVIKWSKLSTADRDFLDSQRSVARGALGDPNYVSRHDKRLVRTADLNWYTNFAIMPVSMQPTPAEEMKAPVPQKPFHRKVLSGKCGCFHLPSSMGTALYWMGEAPACHYLTNIQFSNIQPPTKHTPGYIVYSNEASAGGGITRWAFALNPEYCGMYSVFYKKGNAWHFYEWTWRELTH